LLAGAGAPNPFIPFMPGFGVLFIPKPFEGALGAAAPNWKGAALPVGVEGPGWLAPKEKLKPGAPPADAAGAGADAAGAPKLKEELDVGAVLKGLEAGVAEGVDGAGAGAPNVKLEVGGVAAGAPKPPDIPTPVDPEEPKVKVDPPTAVAGAEPNLAGGASALSSADRLPLFPLGAELALAPDPKLKPNPFAAGVAGLAGSAVAPKLKLPNPVEAGGGIAVAVDGGEKRLFVVLFSVEADVGAPKPGDPPKRDGGVDVAAAGAV
jgi:hypothetical protein